MERRNKQPVQEDWRPAYSSLRRAPIKESKYYETAPIYSTSNPITEEEDEPPKPPLSAFQLATVGRLPMHTTLMPPANGPCPRGQELPDKKKKRRRRRKAKEQAKEDPRVEAN